MSHRRVHLARRCFWLTHLHRSKRPFIGNQAGGRVFLFLQTDDFWHDYNRMVSADVTFVRPPSEAPYGTVAVFEDLYGNRWDLLQYNGSTPYASASA